MKDVWHVFNPSSSPLKNCFSIICYLFKLWQQWKRQNAINIVTWWIMLYIKISTIIMWLCYSEYEKYFFQTVYNSSSLTQPQEERGRPCKGIWVNLTSSYKEAPTLTGSHQHLTQLVSLGFKSQPSLNPKLSFLIWYLFLYNILIIASVSHIRTRVINFYFPSLVEKLWFVYNPYPVFLNIILTWGV